MTLTIQQVEKIEEMYKKGANISQIALTLNITRKTVRKYLKLYHIRELQEVGKRGQGKENSLTSQLQQQQTLAITKGQPTVTADLALMDEKDGEKFATIFAKLNSSESLSEEEAKFLVKVIQKNYTNLDRVLREEVRQGVEVEAKKAFLAKLNGIIEDALTLGLEMHYIAKQYKEFCERRGISFVDAVKIAMELYTKEDTSNETIMKILGYIAQTNKEKQAEQQSSQASFMNAILLANLIKNMYGR